MGGGGAMDESENNARRTTCGVSSHETALCESDQIGSGTRVWAYAHIMNGATVGRDCNICDHVFIESGAAVGDRVTIKNRALLFQGVTIADDVFVGPGVIFTNDRYPRSARMPAASQRYVDTAQWLERTTVERGVSMGAGAIINCGLTLGEYATIGAGAVVTHNVAPHTLVVGNPARQVGWVCVCGVTLPDRMTCGACGRSYTCEVGLLTENAPRPAVLS